MTTDQHEYREYMDQALADLDVPVDQLREASMARGRVVRRRRRAMGVLGVAAGVVLAAAVALPSIAGTDDAADHVAQDGGSPAPEARVRAGEWWNMPGGVMRDRLTELLPEGLTITDANLGDEDLAPGEKPTGGWVSADLLEDGQPAGGINVILDPPSDGDSGGGGVIPCPGESTDTDTCVMAQEADRPAPGSIVRSRSGDVVTISLTHLLPDGGLVYVAASNSSDDKWGRGSSTDREDPALRAAELRAIAEDPTWQDWSPQE